MLAALLLAIAPAAGVQLPAVKHGDLVATLQVRVAEQPVAPGRARALLTITVTGPPTLQVEEPRLEDAFSAWRVAWRTSSWSAAEKGTLECVLGVVQTKPGTVPLPGVRLQARARAQDSWHDVSWLDPLHETRDVAPIVELPEVKSSGRLPWLLSGVGLVLATVLFGWVWRKRQARPVASSEPAWHRAIANLEQARSLEDVTTLVRAFVQEHSAVPASRLTTRELRVRLQSSEELPPNIHEELLGLLDLGDLVKFAGHAMDDDGLAKAREEARQVITGLATWRPGETSPIGEGR